jgi:hypothetical protein
VPVSRVATDGERPTRVFPRFAWEQVRNRPDIIFRFHSSSGTARSFHLERNSSKTIFMAFFNPAVRWPARAVNHVLAPPQRRRLVIRSHGTGTSVVTGKASSPQHRHSSKFRLFLRHGLSCFHIKSYRIKSFRLPIIPPTRAKSLARNAIEPNRGGFRLFLRHGAKPVPTKR